MVPLLYSNIHLATAKQAIALLRTLLASPKRSRLVKSLIVTIPGPHKLEDPGILPYHSTLRKLFKFHLESLQHLQLCTSRFMNAMIYLKECLRGQVSLKTLSILAHGSWESMSTSYLWSILLEFPELEEFWFEFHSMDGIKTEPKRRPPQQLRLPNMRRLRISGAVVSDESLEVLRSMCPNLEILEI